MKRALAIFVLLTLTSMFADNPHNVPRSPIIVAEVDLLTQTYQVGVNNVFPIYAVPVAGLYRVNSYVEDVVPTNPNQYYLDTLWTDDTGNPRLFTGYATGYQLGWMSDTHVVYAVAGSTIQVEVSANINGSTINNQFNLFVTVEKL